MGGGKRYFKSGHLPVPVDQCLHDPPQVEDANVFLWFLHGTFGALGP